ncbi:MAG: hypothetical protein P0S95_05060 [Rhabdochlamydiaceae bacterium]|nr:hypothetical protein [Candidatus Amphrikana amoebophyrae]
MISKFFIQPTPLACPFAGHTSGSLFLTGFLYFIAFVILFIGVNKLIDYLQKRKGKKMY